MKKLIDFNRNYAENQLFVNGCKGKRYFKNSNGLHFVYLPDYSCIRLAYICIQSYKVSKTIIKSKTIKQFWPEEWSECITHIVNNVDKDIWELDNAVENATEPFLISDNDNDSNSVIVSDGEVSSE